MAVDGSYRPKVHRRQGGDEMHVASGGVLEVESGGELRLDYGTVVTLPGTTAYGTGAKLPFWLELPILAQDTAGATIASVTVLAPQKLEVIDVLAQKTGAGSSGTTALGVVVTTSTDGVISDVLNLKGILGILARATKIVPALSPRASGAVIKATRSGSSGTSAAGVNTEITVRVLCLPRATT